MEFERISKAKKNGMFVYKLVTSLGTESMLKLEPIEGTTEGFIVSPKSESNTYNKSDTNIYTTYT